MKTTLIPLVVVVCLIGGSLANCGCLKCCKNLKVVSPPYATCKVIYRDVPTCCPKPLPYSIQTPVVPPSARPTFKDFEYTINLTPTYEQKYVPSCYDLQVQSPVVAPPAPPKLLTGLYTLPERVVLPPPGCPKTNCDPCISIWPDIPLSEQPAPAKKIIYQPILDKLCNEYGYRYGKRTRRNTHEPPIFKNSIEFLTKLLPNLIKLPGNKQTLPIKWRRFNRNKSLITAPPPLETRTLLQKLQTINKRNRRAVIFNDGEIELPYLEVTEIDDDEDPDLDDEDEDTDEDRVAKNLLEPLNFQHLLPHQHLLYLMNTPIRFLHHFHRFGAQIKPIFRSFPQILTKSKQYLREFRRHFRNDLFDIAANLIGDFHGPFRHKRYAKTCSNRPQSRYKRYLLKIVDEDEIHDFLRDKFDNLIHKQSTNHHKQMKLVEAQDVGKKLVLKKLTPKIVVDNSGRPFIELNGNKRPLVWKNRDKTGDKPVKTIKPSIVAADSADIHAKIDELIDKFRDKSADNANTPKRKFLETEQSLQLIREHSQQILVEIQELMALDLDQYATIFNNLNKLELLKRNFVANWENCAGADDLNRKLTLLDDLKEMQQLKDAILVEITTILQQNNNTKFIMRKLIKYLIRLQKLQCLINRIVDDYEHFHNKKQSKLIDYLKQLEFVNRKLTTRFDLIENLKNERNSCIENLLKFLENLHKLLRTKQLNDDKNLYDFGRTIWEIKNNEKLQKNIIDEMFTKINNKQKIRKELKILFDLLNELELAESKARKLLDECNKRQRTNSNVNSDRGGNFKSFSHIIVDDKKPIKLVTNGYTLHAYKITDSF